MNTYFMYVDFIPEGLYCVWVNHYSILISPKIIFFHEAVLLFSFIPFLTLVIVG